MPHSAVTGGPKRSLFPTNDWRMMKLPRVPAVVVLMAAVAVVAAIAASTFTARIGTLAAENRLIVGERELVRITAPSGRTVEAMATIDTGASSSSVDTDVAAKLGLSLVDAETVTVKSALGEEERPVIRVAVQLAGEAQAARVTVSDRTEVDTPVLIGRDDLDGFHVKIGQRQLTTPGAPEPPPALAALLAARSAEFDPASLLALMPLAAVVVVVVRNVFGMTTLGTFSPVLLTFGLLQVGIVPALVLTGMMVAVGIGAEPWLRRYHVPRVARVAILIGLVSSLLLAVEFVAGVRGSSDSWGAAFPLVVTAVIVERLWEEWDVEGGRTALLELTQTLAVALLVLPLLLAPPVRWLGENVPLAFALTCVMWAWVAGTYRGLRVSELFRFGTATSTEEVAR